MSCQNRFCGFCSRQLFHTINNNKWLHNTRTVMTSTKATSFRSMPTTQEDLHNVGSATTPFNQPLSGNSMPRAGNTAETLGTFMRLPSTPLDNIRSLDVCILGIPIDIGTSLRPGTRFGPRQVRQESAMLRPYNMATKAKPFDSLNIGDIGDIPINTFDLKKSVDIITDFFTGHILSPSSSSNTTSKAIIPVTIGGDHTIALPILRAVKKKYGPVALIHVDAHADVNPEMFGEQIAHGTPFFRAVEEGLIDCDNVFQIGLRGTGYAAEDFDWCRNKFGNSNVVTAEEIWGKSLTPLMETIRNHIGSTKPVYLSFDIDSLDPAFAPGTGTLECGGLTIYQAFEIVRGLKGLNLVGCDLVEVSPPFDMNGTTALTASNLIYEMLCVLPGVKYG